MTASRLHRCCLGGAFDLGLVAMVSDVQHSPASGTLDRHPYPARSLFRVTFRTGGGFTDRIYERRGDGCAEAVAQAHRGLLAAWAGTGAEEGWCPDDL